MGYSLGPAPISHPPDPGDRVVHAPVLHRVIATVHWTDGSTTEHRLTTSTWTSDRVRIWIESEHERPRRTADLWLPLDQVRRNTDPPELGELIPAPQGGSTAVRAANQKDIDNWPTAKP